MAQPELTTVGTFFQEIFRALGLRFPFTVPLSRLLVEAIGRLGMALPDWMVAGVINAPDAAGFERCNVGGTLAMLAAATAAGVRRFVHVSSLAAREPRLSLYGTSKARAEELVEGSGLDWAIVRPPAVYGPGDKETLDLFRMAKLGLVMVPARDREDIVDAPVHLGEAPVHVASNAG